MVGTSYGAALAFCAYLAWGLATSPMPIAALLVMLLAKDPRRTSTSFTVTWLALQFLAISAFAFAARTFIHVDPTKGEAHRTGTWMIGVGIACFVMAGALALWNRSHPNPSRGKSTRKFLDAAQNAGPKDAAYLALLMAIVNITNLPYWIGMGLMLERAHLSWPDRFSIIVICSIVASLTFIVITVAAALAEDRVKKLAAWGKDKLTKNSSAAAPFFAITCGIIFCFLGASDLGWI